MLLALAAGGLWLLLRGAWREQAPPTVLGWRASVSIAAGEGVPGLRDGAAGQARFAEPFGVAVDKEGNVYLTDAGESNRVRKLTPEGVVTTLAGGREGYADGRGAEAAFNTPSSLAIDRGGNLYVADTGNNRVRRVTPEGVVTTVAGSGEAGFQDGPASGARFDAPVGVAVDSDGNVYVADSYNDRVRLVTKDGEVRTLAGAGRPGHLDGPAAEALFDTPCALAVSEAGDVYVADTGNNRLRKITKDGRVFTLPAPAPAASPGATPEAAPQPPTPPPPPLEVSKPAGLALTHDGFLYVTELDRGRVTQVAPDGTARHLAGLGSGFADGDGTTAARFNQPAGVALAPGGSLLVADSANYTLRRLSPPDVEAAKAAKDDGRPAPHPPQPTTTETLPRIPPENFAAPFPWPLDPQGRPHELVGTLGEVRGSYDTDDSRHHLHAGIDVFGVLGQTVRAVREEKVSSPLANWGFGTLNEGFRAGLLAYVHLRVGRDERDEVLAGSPFVAVRDEAGKTFRVRLRRGTRLRVGDPLGSVNRMYHVHMNLGPPGNELNPLALRLAGFSDSKPPVVERDGITLLTESGEPLKEKAAGRLVVRGRVRLVVDAYDQVDGNQARRRLGLYRLGYQLLLPSGEPAPGFERPLVTMEFGRLPPGNEATKIVYAGESGITVYGSRQTRFLYEVTNTVRDGRAERGVWDTAELPPGDYILRVLAADHSGNEATANRDLPVRLVRD